MFQTSHPSRGAWIEIHTLHLTASVVSLSHPSRGAWIEIRDGTLYFDNLWAVAPLAGCVD